MQVIEKRDNHVLLEISNMTKSDTVIEYGLQGGLKKP
jgi:hypothetical protein